MLLHSDDDDDDNNDAALGIPIALTHFNCSPATCRCSSISSSFAHIQTSALTRDACSMMMTTTTKATRKRRFVMLSLAAAARLGQRQTPFNTRVTAATAQRSIMRKIYL